MKTIWRHSRQHTLELIAEDDSIFIGLSGLPAGVYFVEVQGHGSVPTVHKFIKQ